MIVTCDKPCNVCGYYCGSYHDDGKCGACHESWRRLTDAMRFLTAHPVIAVDQPKFFALLNMPGAE